MTPLTILVVEDDRLQAERLVKWLRREWPGLEIVQLHSVLAFHDWTGAVDARAGDQVGIDLVILDVMLAAYTLHEVGARYPAPIPPAVMGGDAEQGGFHCLRMLRARAWGRELPVVLYSILAEDDLRTIVKQDPWLLIRGKTGDRPTDLILAMRTLLAAKGYELGRVRLPRAAGARALVERPRRWAASVGFLKDLRLLLGVVAALLALVTAALTGDIFGR